MLNNLTIKLKITLWYALLTSLLLALFIPVLYKTISYSLHNKAQNELMTEMANVLIKIEFENNQMTLEDTFKPADHFPTLIINNKNEIIYANEQSMWLRAEQTRTNHIIQTYYHHEYWYLYDRAIIKEDRVIGHIKMSYTLADVDETLERLVLIIWFAIPLYLAIAILGCLWIAKLVLAPIRKISNIANEIESSDLSRRIEGVASKDEVGQLVLTFNHMLNRLEHSFKKEQRFTSDASHELRTPITVINAYIEYLINYSNQQLEPLDSDALKAIHTIHKENKKMGKIISQLLMITRGYEKKYQLEWEEINGSEIMDDILEELQPVARSNHIKIEAHIEPNIIFVADQSLITQLVLNLIENAIKYNKENGVIYVALTAHHSKIVLKVRDTGIGINESDQLLIFDRFYQVDKSRSLEGTGIGLSIVKWIVEEHRGSITVQSHLDEGTTFEVTLPRA